MSSITTTTRTTLLLLLLLVSRMSDAFFLSPTPYLQHPLDSTTTTTCHIAAVNSMLTSFCPKRIARLQAKTKTEEDNDDGGWGLRSAVPSDDDDIVDRITAATTTTTTTNQVEERKQQQSSPPSNDSNADDLFIPIFALISITGFVGLYAYEMIRLYLRGELYLPF